MVNGPLIVSHTNVRRYYDVERNTSDEHLQAVGEHGGVIGVNAVLVSARQEEATLDRYVDHLERNIELTSIDNVGIGFDFFERIYQAMPPAEKEALHRLAKVCFVPDLKHHGHARNLTRRLIERGFADEQIEKILFRNWMRLLDGL
jgi:membrane dipeptidase